MAVVLPLLLAWPAASATCVLGEAPLARAVLLLLAHDSERPCDPWLSAQKEDPPPLGTRIPRLAGTRQQLDYARRAKQAYHACEKEEQREDRLQHAIRAYQALRRYFPRDRALGAEGSFRAGELLRAAGQEKKSLREFRRTTSLHPGSDFAHRARLEIAHIHRRAADLNRALDEYLALAGERKALDKHREQAWYWAGRCWSSQGDQDAARGAWRGMTRRQGPALLRIAAWDELALSWIAEGDLEAAAGELLQCRLKLGKMTAELTDMGEKTRTAIENMRAIKALQCAIKDRQRGLEGHLSLAIGA